MSVLFQYEDIMNYVVPMCNIERGSDSRGVVKGTAGKEGGFNAREGYARSGAGSN